MLSQAAFGPDFRRLCTFLIVSRPHLHFVRTRMASLYMGQRGASLITVSKPNVSPGRTGFIRSLLRLLIASDCASYALFRDSGLQASHQRSYITSIVGRRHRSQGRSRRSVFFSGINPASKRP